MLLAAFLALAAAETPPPPCDPDLSRAANVRTMARHPEGWLNRCVRLRGYVAGDLFYADANGAYAAVGHPHDRPNDGWAGLYLSGDGPRTLRRGTVTGRVGDCQRDYDLLMAAAGQDAEVAMSGPCARLSGLYLTDARFRDEGAARFERPMGEAARARFGNIEPQGPGVDPPGEVVALADRFLAALRAGDGAGLESFVEVYSGDVPGTEAERAAFRAYLAGDRESPLRPLRLAAGLPQRAYFRQASPGYVWHICFCLTADCAGRWPIHGADATAGRSRPYVCVTAFRSDFRQGPLDRLGLPMIESLFTEPANSSTR